MAAAHAVVGLRGGAPALDTGRVAAVLAWELERGVYVPDTDVAEAALNRLLGPGVEVGDWERVVVPPVEEWARLPQWCCYVVMRRPGRELGHSYARGASTASTCHQVAQRGR